MSRALGSWAGPRTCNICACDEHAAEIGREPGAWPWLAPQKEAEKLRLTAYQRHDKQAEMDASSEECAECEQITQQKDKAAREYDRSAEAEARVKLRRHVREAHGRELPWPW